MGTVLKNVGIWIEGIDIAGVSNSVGLPVTAATPESTTFKNDGWMDHEAGGLKSSAISYAGYVPLSDIDREMFESLATKGISTIAPIGNAPGNVAYVVPYVESEFAQSGSIGELLAFTFSAAGDNAPYRAQVFDVREGIAAAVTTPRRQLGAIPSGQTLHLWTHVAHNAGILEIDLFSAASAVGGTVALQARRSSIAGTGLYVLSVDGPVTDQYWEMVYTPTGATPDFDVSAATFFAAQNFVAVPLTPPITPPTPGTVTVRGGLSADDTPTAPEINIVGMNHVISFPAFTNMHVLVWRLASQGDLTSIVLGSDPTNQNQIGGFTKFANTINKGGVAGNVWVSDQSLTFAAPDTIETA